MHRNPRVLPAAVAAVLGLLALSLSPAASAAPPSSSGFGPVVPLDEHPVITGRPGDGHHTVVRTTDRRGRVLAGGTSTAFPSAPAARPQAVSSTQLSTWVVHYDAAFQANAPAQAAFQRAVDTWSHIVVSSVPITVDATLDSSLPAGALGGASPTGYAKAGGYYYPVALANALSGTDQNGAGSEITADFANDDAIFYYGSDPTAIAAAPCTVPPDTTPSPGSCYDFESVVLHELGHGLGFIGSATVDQGDTLAHYGDSTAASATPLIYDAYTETGAHTAILDYPNHSTALTDALTSGAVYWDGPEGTGADRGREPRLYAPYDPSAPARGFEVGSSFSHLSDASYPRGDRDSLMTPFAEQGDVVRDPGEIALGMLRDLGWATPALPGVSYTPLPDQVQVWSSGSILPAGTTKEIALAGSNGIPSDAAAVVLDLTAAAPSTTGTAVLLAYGRPRAAGAPLPQVASLVAHPGYVRDGLVTVPLGYGRARLTVSSGAARLWASAVGYYSPTGGQGFVPTVPKRVVDTRTGLGVRRGPIGQSPVAVHLSGVPSTATAVVVELTEAGPTNTSAIQGFASDRQPTIGDVHVKPAQSATNLATLRLGADGQVAFRTTLGTAHVIVDLVGWYDTTGGLFRPLLQQRVLGPLTLGVGVRDVTLDTTYGVPAAATAALLDAVSYGPTATTSLDVYPTATNPGTLTITQVARQNASGPTVTELDTTHGRVRLSNSAGTVRTGLDLFGWFGPA